VTSVVLITFIWVQIIFLKKSSLGLKRLIPSLYFIIFLISEFFILVFFDKGILPVMGDQMAYISFGQENYHEHLFNQHYYFITWIFTQFSILDPLVGLRALNFLFHLGTLLFFSRTLEIFKVTGNVLNFSIFLLALLPSFIFFDFLIMRESLIILLYSAMLYVLSKIYFSLESKKDIFFLLIFSILMYTIKTALVLIIPIIFLFLIRERGYKNILFFLVFILFFQILIQAIYGSDLFRGLDQVISIIFQAFEKNSIAELIMKLVYGILALNFLYINDNILYFFLRRLMFLDSLVIPFLYVISFLWSKNTAHRNFLFYILFAYIVYIFLYIGLEPKNSLSYRAQLPFIYSSLITIIIFSKDKLEKITSNKIF